MLNSTIIYLSIGAQNRPPTKIIKGIFSRRPLETPKSKTFSFVTKSLIQRLPILPNFSHKNEPPTVAHFAFKLS